MDVIFAGVCKESAICWPLWMGLNTSYFHRLTSNWHVFYICRFQTLWCL